VGNIEMNDTITKLPTRETVTEGSTVRLKSGGPSMVVMLRKADMALCQWHIENGELTSAWLQLSCLELVK
jgi:uncharacterized protein YodC (DUF2158 family)